MPDPEQDQTEYRVYSDSIWQVGSDPNLYPMWNYAQTLPLSQLPRAMEIMRLCALLYVEMHKQKEP